MPLKGRETLGTSPFQFILNHRSRASYKRVALIRRRMVSVVDAPDESQPQHEAILTAGMDSDPRWEAFARAEPYFAVLTSAKYLTANLTAASEADFFESGERFIDMIFETIDQVERLRSCRRAQGDSHRQQNLKGSGHGGAGIAGQGLVRFQVQIEDFVRQTQRPGGAAQQLLRSEEIAAVHGEKVAMFTFSKVSRER